MNSINSKTRLDKEQGTGVFLASAFLPPLLVRAPSGRSGRIHFIQTLESLLCILSMISEANSLYNAPLTEPRGQRAPRNCHSASLRTTAGAEQKFEPLN